MVDNAAVSAERENLHRLILIRIVVLGGQAIALYYFANIQPLGLRVGSISAVLLSYALITLATWVRTRYATSIGSLEFFAHLQIDILFFSAVLYFSGGASNPFISYYLIPISIAAIALPRALSVIVALASLLAYSALLRYFIAIPALAPAHHGTEPNLHILGMWVNFAISAAIITYFVSLMATTIREQQKALAIQHEDQLRNEQLLAIGALAAGTAHELGTPLNTMKLLVDDMVGEARVNPTDLKTLQQQLDHCKDTLQQLVETARQSDKGEIEPQTLLEYFHHLIDRWQLLRPELSADVRYGASLSTQSADFHPTVAQSLLNLLNNAGDASAHRVEVEIDCNVSEVELKIRDYGDGIPPELVSSLGTAFISEKSSGLGLGLFLSRATLSRYGGTVQLQNAAGNGTLTTVKIPLCAT